MLFLTGCASAPNENPPRTETPAKDVSTAGPVLFDYRAAHDSKIKTGEIFTGPGEAAVTFAVGDGEPSTIPVSRIKAIALERLIPDKYPAICAHLPSSVSREVSGVTIEMEDGKSVRGCFAFTVLFVHQGFDPNTDKADKVFELETMTASEASPDKTSLMYALGTFNRHP